MKLTFKKTIEVSSVDLRDFAPDPPIIYEVYVNRHPKWTDAIIDFMKSEFTDIEAALSVVGLQIASLKQDKEVLKIGSKEAAKELMESLDEDGEAYILGMAIRLYRYILNFEEERLGNSEEPSSDSTNGSTPELSLSAAKQEN